MRKWPIGSAPASGTVRGGWDTSSASFPAKTMSESSSSKVTCWAQPRFSKAPGNRNMAVFGMMDENRHTQLQLFFPHANIKRSRQWDWGHKALRTNEWAAVAARSLFDDIVTSRDAISTAIMLTFAFETGFTNMQFLGLAAEYLFMAATSTVPLTVTAPGALA